MLMFKYQLIYFFVDVQNNINVDPKHRHDIPRHQVRQVDTFTSFISLLFAGFFYAFFMVVVPFNADKFFLAKCFQVTCSICDTEQEVSIEYFDGVSRNLCIHCL
jgi:hypothetical protein